MSQSISNFEYNDAYELQGYELAADGSRILEGDFPQEDNEKKMAIRRINTTLCILLSIMIAITMVSYYFATANEMTLNTLSRQTTAFNDENADLQNKLDKLKSFNNVDMTMQKNNILTKAKQVIEVPAVSATSVSTGKKANQKPFTWAIGY